MVQDVNEKDCTTVRRIPSLSQGVTQIDRARRTSRYTATTSSPTRSRQRGSLQTQSSLISATVGSDPNARTSRAPDGAAMSAEHRGNSETVTPGPT